MEGKKLEGWNEQTKNFMNKARKKTRKREDNKEERGGGGEV